MVHTIYVEKGVADHPRTRLICERFRHADVIECERYGEVFNRRKQNFRLQKKRPALILAAKHEGFVLETPEGYGIGAPRNYYFSHLLNCPYDCRYCFLQGMYRSANYVLFVNYEDFKEYIRQVGDGESQACFFSGYDCDSLAFESVTGFAAEFLNFFEGCPTSLLELRTKSVQLSALEERLPLENVVVAYSLTPEEIGEEYEDKTPPLARRIRACAQLQEFGWPVGLRFDPIIYNADYQEQYIRLFADVFSEVDARRLHSVSLGPFRLPKETHGNMVRLYPEEKLFASVSLQAKNLVSYKTDIEKEMIDFCTDELLRYIPDDLFFPCTY